MWLVEPWPHARILDSLISQALSLEVQIPANVPFFFFFFPFNFLEEIISLLKPVISLVFRSIGPLISQQQQKQNTYFHKLKIKLKINTHSEKIHVPPRHKAQSNFKLEYVLLFHIY